MKKLIAIAVLGSDVFAAQANDIVADNGVIHVIDSVVLPQ